MLATITRSGKKQCFCRREEAREKERERERGREREVAGLASFSHNSSYKAHKQNIGSLARFFLGNFLLLRFRGCNACAGATTTFHGLLEGGANCSAVATVFHRRVMFAGTGNFIAGC